MYICFSFLILYSSKLTSLISSIRINMWNSYAEESLKVISLGVGTKIVTRDQLAMSDDMSKIVETPQSLLLASSSLSNKITDESTSSCSRAALPPSSSLAYRDRIIDCHAEILAHRGLKRFLLEQSWQALKSPSPSCIFEVVKSGSMKCLKLRPNIKFHLYSSSQPCGNASIKKWAKNKGVVQYASLSSNEYPKVSTLQFISFIFLLVFQ